VGDLLLGLDIEHGVGWSLSDDAELDLAFGGKEFVYLSSLFFLAVVDLHASFSLQILKRAFIA